MELPSGISTDDTHRIVMGNIDIEHFYQIAIGLLIQTIEGIVLLSGKNDSAPLPLCRAISYARTGKEPAAGGEGNQVAIQVADERTEVVMNTE